MALTGIPVKSLEDGNQYWGRITGADYDQLSTKWVAEQFEHLGLRDVRTQDFDRPTQWYAASWDVSLSDGFATLEGREMACLCHRLAADPSNLTSREAGQIETASWRIYRAHEELQPQCEQGMIAESVWNGFRRTAQETMSTRGMRGC